MPGAINITSNSETESALMISYHEDLVTSECIKGYIEKGYADNLHDGISFQSYDDDQLRCLVIRML